MQMQINGHCLKQRRQWAGLSQQALAEQAEVNRVHLSRIELKEWATITPRVAAALAKALGCSVPDLQLPPTAPTVPGDGLAAVREGGCDA
jgi:transcriptional regulator with XRE-family HTH domain